MTALASAADSAGNGADAVDTVGQRAPTSEELLLLVHRGAVVRAQARLDAVIAMARDDIAGCLAALLPVDAPRRRDWGVWFAIWSSADAHPAFAAELRRHLAVTFDDLRRVVAAACGSGRLPAGTDVDRWTRHALVRLHEVGVQALLDPVSWPAARQHEAADAIVDDLAATEAPVLQDRGGPVRDGPHPPA